MKSKLHFKIQGANPCAILNHARAYICLTSFPATGFSTSDRCVNFENPRSASRSASSAIWFCVRTRVARFGIERATVGAKLVTRLRASSSVRSRGLSGKFAMTVMSLSVKSMASWS